MIVDKQLIIDACNSSVSMAEASVKVGINYQTFRKYAKELNVYKINQGAKGKTKPNDWCRYPLEDILDNKYPHYSSHKLRIRLIKEGIKDNKCELCGQVPEWNNKPLSLQLDHIDGNRFNQSLTNLRIVCPNCHTQTDTYGSKNRNASVAEMD